MINILDFLPKYPNIENSNIPYMNPYDKNFYNVLYHKKEFYDERLDPIEPYPENKGDLMKHQKIVARFLSGNTPYDKILLAHSLGSGKCLALNTPVIMYDGTIKMVQDVEEGELLMGDDSTPRTVLSIARGEDEMYDIIPTKGDKYTVNQEHILCLKASGYPAIKCSSKCNTNFNVQWVENNKFMSKTFTYNSENKDIQEEKAIEFKKSIKCEQIIEITVKDFLKLSKWKQDMLKGYKVAIDFPEKNIPIDPYMIGYWLGDGTSRDSAITSQDSSVIYYFVKNLGKYDLSLNYRDKYTYGISGFTGKVNSNFFLTTLKELNLISNKHIPDIYKYNSIENRLKLLAGILDSDGHLQSNGFEFTQKNEKMIDDVIYLARSLGFSCYKQKKQTSWTYKGEKSYGEVWRIFINGAGIEQIPTLIPRKKATIRKQKKDVLVSGIKIKHVGRDNYYGFVIDKNSRFLIGDFTVTHNTCSAIGIIEQIKNEKTNFRGALILTRGKVLQDNFKNELIYKCTAGQYEPEYEAYEEITSKKEAHRKSKSVSVFYEFKKFQEISKEIEGMTDEQIKERYSNYIITIDEVHNIRELKKEKNIDVYKSFHRLCHIPENIKVILLSGTPIKDVPEEISSIMNLLLPMNQQLMTGTDFHNEFFTSKNILEDDEDYDDNKKGILYTLKKNKIPELKKIFRGYISYLQSSHSDIKKTFIGKSMGTLKYLKVCESTMSEFQTESYAVSVEKDSSTKGIYTNSSQSILFVYPDGSWGEKGFKTYITETNKSIVGKTTTKKSYTLTDAFKNFFKGTNNDKLKVLQKFSSKYAFVVKKILEAKESGKLIFIYCNFVTGSGIILLSKILELFGISDALPYTNREIDSIPEGHRYGIISSLTSSAEKIQKLIKIFNDPLNMNGKYISVILGSTVIGEGISLKNVQEEYILSPWWNYSRIEQAIARGYRFGSHKNLIDAGITPTVDIYQMVSMPLSEDIPSLDLKMYQISEIKDINIKQIEQVMKTSAIDCALNYNRNYIEGYDNERECGYQDCNYKCDGVKIEDIPDSELDYSTYQLYYSKDIIDKIIRDIVNLFKTNFKYDLSYIIQYLKYSEFEVITALRKIIYDNIIIKDRYGFDNFLREQYDIYFLVKSLSIESNYLSEYYAKYINIKPSIDTQKIENILTPSIITNLFLNKNLDLIKTLSIPIQQELLENSILASKLNLDKNKETRELIVDYFKPKITEKEDIIVSTLNPIKRCFKDMIWIDCPEDINIKITSHEETLKNQIETNNYGYYGKYNSKTNIFCLVKVLKENLKDKRKINTGKNCKTWAKEELHNIIINIFKLSAPPTASVFKLTKSDLDKKLAGKKKYAEKIMNFDKEYTTNELANILYWISVKGEELCSAIYNFLLEKNLVIEDLKCGQK
jgi:hypothetical protein